MESFFDLDSFSNRSLIALENHPFIHQICYKYGAETILLNTCFPHEWKLNLRLKLSSQG